jgi:hypothetical protein
MGFEVEWESRVPKSRILTNRSEPKEKQGGAARFPPLEKSGH